MEHSGRKFFNFIVDKDLQLRIMAYSIIYMICFTLVILCIVLYPLISDMFFSPDTEIQYIAARNFLTIGKKIVPALIAVFILFAIYQLIITHRICGPLVNFTNTFARIAEGNLSQKVRIRRHDYLKEECEHINNMIAGLARIIERVTDDHKRLKDNLESIVIDVSDPATKEKIERSLDIIKEDAEYVSKSLGYFRTPGNNNA
jgi:methyl-accepting chemotaxis protein